MTSHHSTVAAPGMFSEFRAHVQKQQPSNQPLILMQSPEKGCLFFYFFQFPFLPNLPEQHGWDRDMEGTNCVINTPSSIQWDSYSTAHRQSEL